VGFDGSIDGHLAKIARMEADRHEKNRKAARLVIAGRKEGEELMELLSALGLDGE
jgi:hypothetical protein